MTARPATASDVPPTEVARLRGSVCGAVLTAADHAYADARRLHNAAVDTQPAVMVQAGSVLDVSEALRFARERGLSVSVKGGGHGVSGYALGGDVVIDLSEFRGVRVDPFTRTVTVRAGSTWKEVDAASQAYGLAMPGGRVSSVGVAGLTLGGGEGWLSPKHGLTADNLVSATMVTADGSRRTVSDSAEPELFWALRGGGGSFGVVTSFTFRLHPIDPLVFGGMLLYRLSDAHDVLGALCDLHAAGHDELGAAAAFLTAPPASFVPGDLVGRPVLAVVPAWLGDPARGADVMRPLWEGVRPIADASAPMHYPALQSMLDASAPPGLRQRWSASTLPQLADSLVDVMVDAAADRPSPLSKIVISALRGEVTRTSPDATAYPHRDASWLVHAAAAWPESSGDKRNATWAHDLEAAVRGRETGAYLNLDGEVDDSRIRWAFGPDRYRRLQRVKSTWDPDDVFHHCHRIVPSQASRVTTQQPTRKTR